MNMHERLQNNLLGLLSKHYKFNIFEYRNIRGESLWGAKYEGVNYNQYIVVCNFNNLYSNRQDLEQYFRSEETSRKLKQVIIVVTSAQSDADIDLIKAVGTGNYDIRYNYIIVDDYSGTVIYNDNEVSELAEIVKRIAEKTENRGVAQETYKGVVTKYLIMANVIMFFITAYFSGSLFNMTLEVLLFFGAKNNALILNGEYYRLFTAMFLHGGLTHIAFNMYALYALGPLIEKVYSKKAFILIYFISGLTSSLASFIFSPNTSVGASGAIFGLLGAALIFGFKMKKLGNKAFLNSIIQVIFINIFIGVTIPNIDNFGHLGGLVGGVIVSLIYTRIKGKEN
jgi:rhomboid protease GluP